MIHVCVPVLKRYDLLQKLLLSLHGSSLRPETIYVIDNGRDKARLEKALEACPTNYFVERPDQPMGVAESWNWFLLHVPEHRVICNDDVVFSTDSLQIMANVDADLVWASGCGFSCYLMRDTCLEKVGLFDETISPGYGYYEDEDYLQRLDGRGTKPAKARAIEVECGVVHLHSSTLKASTDAEVLDHHRKFKIAQDNYARKWGVTF